MMATKSPSLETVDSLAGILFVVMLVTGGMFVRFELPFIVIAVVFPALWYFIFVVIEPFRRSFPYKNDLVQGSLGDPTIRLRKSVSLDTRVVDLWFRRYIIFNANDLDGPCQNWRAIVGHELEHVVQGDSKYFHFAGITGASTLAMLAYLALSLGRYTFDEASALNFSGPDWAFVFTPVLYIAVGAFFVLWVRQSLHIREFRADQAALQKAGTDFEDWIRREKRRESCAPIRWHKIGTRILKWFTHPSFTRREAALQTNDEHSWSLFIWKVTQSACFIFGGGMLSAAAAMGLIAFAPQSSLFESQAVQLLVLGSVMVLPLGAAIGVISVYTLDAIVGAGWVRGSVFVGAVALVCVGCLLVFTLGAQVTGFYDLVTAGLPPAPPGSSERVVDDVLPFLQIFGNFALILVTSNLVAKRFLGRIKYFSIVHLVFGLSSAIGAFLLSKFQWWMLG